MKATTQFQLKLAAAIQPLDTPERRGLYTTGDFFRSDRVQDLDKRYRWDLLWSAAALDRSIYDDLTIEGLKDTHTDTALRNIVAPL